MPPKIKKISFLFRLLFQAFLFLIPCGYILAWIYAPAEIFPLGKGIGFNMSAIPQTVEVLHTLSFSTKFFAALVGAVPVIIIEFIIYCLVKLFQLYERGEIFSLSNVTYIKKIGYALFINQFVSALSQGFVSAIVTFHNPHGFRYANITITRIDLAMVLAAFLIILISWIMAEGCRLREEQQLTI